DGRAQVGKAGGLKARALDGAQVGLDEKPWAVLKTLANGHGLSSVPRRLWTGSRSLSSTSSGLSKARRRRPRSERSASRLPPTGKHRLAASRRASAGEPTIWYTRGRPRVTDARCKAWRAASPSRPARSRRSGAGSSGRASAADDAGR